mmetsp:Transcript_72999/g.128623  ORF Transcript_72999/g.128623 Transcript_72999/m.128623 type:complete len:126 (+) Transcript_72999:628-1005(+)
MARPIPTDDCCAPYCPARRLMMHAGASMRCGHTSSDTEDDNTPYHARRETVAGPTVRMDRWAILLHFTGQVQLESFHHCPRHAPPSAGTPPPPGMEEGGPLVMGSWASRAQDRGSQADGFLFHKR